MLMRPRHWLARPLALSMSGFSDLWWHRSVKGDATGTPPYLAVPDRRLVIVSCITWRRREMT